jgi:hypothetical protein
MIVIVRSCPPRSIAQPSPKCSPVELSSVFPAQDRQREHSVMQRLLRLWAFECALLCRNTFWWPWSCEHELHKYELGAYRGYKRRLLEARVLKHTKSASS